MKIKPAHFNYIKAKIELFISNPDNQAKLAAHKKCVSSMRYRHDVARAAGVTSAWICDNLYNYMDDTHLDTALRNIVK